MIRLNMIRRKCVKGGSGELGERICSSGEIFSFKSIKGKWTEMNGEMGNAIYFL